MYYQKGLLMFLVLIPTIFGASSLLCSTLQNPNVFCQFPFIYEGIKYEECIRINDPDNLPWCSTNTTNQDVHVLGNWGHCTTECLSNRGDEKEIVKGIPILLEVKNGNSFCSNCVPWAECSWAQRIINFVSRFSKENQIRQRFIQILRDHSCPDKKFHICCGALDTVPRPVNIVKSQSVLSVGDANLGTWKPRATDDNQECGLSSRPGHIFGGENAKLGDYPFMALLGYDTKGALIPNVFKLYLCGGTLINKHYVITAAHCHSPSQPILEVVLGDFNLDSDPDCDDLSCNPRRQVRTPSVIIQHEKWNLNNFASGYDIALIRLNTPVILAFEDPSRSRISPICIPWRDTDPGRHLSSNTKATVAGWGKKTIASDETLALYKKFSAGSDILQKLDVDLLSFETCRSKFSSKLVLNSQICAGGIPGKDSCGGDSGGPLMYSQDDSSFSPLYLIGIVSYGSTQCDKGFPGIYTKVEDYIEWLNSHMVP